MLISKKVVLDIQRMHAFGIFDKSVFNKKILHFFMSCFCFQVQVSTLKYSCFSFYVLLKYFMSFTQNRLRLRCRSWPLLRRCSKSLMVFRRTSISLFFSSWRCCSFCKNTCKGSVVKYHIDLSNNTI